MTAGGTLKKEGAQSGAKFLGGSKRIGHDVAACPISVLKVDNTKARLE